MQTEQLKYKGAEDRIAENKLVDMRQTVLVVSCSLGKTVELICILCVALKTMRSLWHLQLLASSLACSLGLHERLEGGQS